jgi:hypothetical protein
MADFRTDFPIEINVSEDFSDYVFKFDFCFAWFLGCAWFMLHFLAMMAIIYPSFCFQNPCRLFCNPCRRMSDVHKDKDLKFGHIYSSWEDVYKENEEKPGLDQTYLRPGCPSCNDPGYAYPPGQPVRSSGSDMEQLETLIDSRHSKGVQNMKIDVSAAFHVKAQNGRREISTASPTLLNSGVRERTLKAQKSHADRKAQHADLQQEGRTPRLHEVEGGSDDGSGWHAQVQLQGPSVLPPSSFASELLEPQVAPTDLRVSSACPRLRGQSCPPSTHAKKRQASGADRLPMSLPKESTQSCSTPLTS